MQTAETLTNCKMFLKQNIKSTVAYIRNPMPRPRCLIAIATHGTDAMYTTELPPATCGRMLSLKHYVYNIVVVRA